MTPSINRATALPEGTPHVPVAIVGAGACGLVSALSLRNAGIDCVVLERDAVPSGSTALSSGLIPACGTRMQRALIRRVGAEGKPRDNGPRPRR